MVPTINIPTTPTGYLKLACRDLAKIPKGIASSLYTAVTNPRRTLKNIAVSALKFGAMQASGFAGGKIAERASEFVAPAPESPLAAFGIHTYDPNQSTKVFVKTIATVGSMLLGSHLIKKYFNK